MTTTDPRTAMSVATSNHTSPSGPDSLSGHLAGDAQALTAVEGQDSPQANSLAAPKHQPPAGSTKTTRPTTPGTAPMSHSPAGPDSLNGHDRPGTQAIGAVEGQDSPQARCESIPMAATPAGSTDARTATPPATPTGYSLSGTSILNGHAEFDAQESPAVEGQDSPQARSATAPAQRSPAGSKTAPPANQPAPPRFAPLEGHKTSQDHSTPGTQSRPVLADPLLALAADVLDDLEKVRIANENRLRQLTRTGLDADGMERGFGLDETHPDVARLAALVAMLAEAEHKATLNLQRVMRGHPLGPWVKATTGIGQKQGARLIAAIGDPYWNTLHDRPRTVSELWAYCGYHVIFPAGHKQIGNHVPIAGGEQNGSGPGHAYHAAHGTLAGVAPKRQRGQRANWSATAKMRAYLAAESCMKQRESPYRAVYDTARAKYAEAVHDGECARCGPRNNPAKPGSPLSEGHKHARALRAVAKEILRDLWREARAFHIR